MVRKFRVTIFSTSREEPASTSRACNADELQRFFKLLVSFVLPFLRNIYSFVTETRMANKQTIESLKRTSLNFPAISGASTLTMRWSTHLKTSTKNALPYLGASIPAKLVKNSKYYLCSEIVDACENYYLRKL